MGFRRRRANESRKIAISLQYAPYCYQIYHSPLHREPHASQASEAALPNIANDAWFFTDSAEAWAEDPPDEHPRVAVAARKI
ncbi:hypothetical protein CBW46_020760 [Paenibacillus xerothermodurans]|uniref:Uncharacterized protein n=1 Tax=Paenibacillus xerothermodurans TaxID=1977292 RepID=A0A2W1NHK7_PAEXE|nr:hypothetical protein CBW46_020760 [Paenibacillus xerothermodurans]